MKRLTISFKIAILLVGLSLIFLLATVAWITQSNHAQAEKEMLEKSQILSKQMSAVWEFIDINQKRIDTDSDGTQNFKGIYCAIAGKSIAALFARDTDYEIRYINTNPRSESAFPDSFELLAYQELEAGLEEYYQISTYQGKDVFRYVTPLYIEKSCLDCHGEPKGEIDITGYAKEGLKEGDLGGAISIVMPISMYMSGVENSISQQIFYLSSLIISVVVIVFMAIRALVARPLSKLEYAAEQIEQGDLNVDVSDIQTTREIYDLSKRFNSMAKQLKDSYENLEDQVEERTKQLANVNNMLELQRIELEKTNQLLQAESQYKSDFLAIMSHELRTPLTSIIAFIEIWEKSQGEVDERERVAIDEIKENGQLLLQMINNILETAKSKEGKSSLQLELFDMVDLIGSIENTVGFIAKKRDINLITDVHPDTPIIRADWEKMRRIVENLTSNAIKFTQHGGGVRIEVRYEESGSNIIIQVSDTGIGIKSEDLPFIFNKFAQSDKSSNRRYNGSGLGLSVVKDLVEMHGGVIEVKSVYKQGSTFLVRIPVEVMNYGDIQ